MNQSSRFARWTRFVGAVLTATMVMSMAQIGVSNAASTTGIINGTVTDVASKAPIAGAVVTVASPSTSSKTTTNAQGFFSLTGLTPDTYTVVVAANGYTDVTIGGVNVSPDEATALTPTVSKSLTKIGRTTARNSTAFQPTNTQNTYSVNATQIATIQGDPNNINEVNLLQAIPGVSLDSSGYPVLRGGRENEEGFQFEGISYTDPITNQFVNSLTIHGASSFQVIPGAGPASQGNAGTGSINITAKRGSRPASAQLGFEDAFSSPEFFQMSTDYGFATPNGRLSNYFSFVGNGGYSQAGARGTRTDEVGDFNGQSYSGGRDFINNFVYKFGKDNSQSLQLLYQNQVYDFKNGYGGVAGYHYITGDPNIVNLNATGLPFTAAQVSAITGLSEGQTGRFAAARPNGQTQPNETIKLEYDNNLNASTFLQLAFYKVNSTAIFDFAGGAGFPAFGGANDVFLHQGGLRTGFKADVTKQLGSKHLLSAGARYEYLNPVDDEVSADLGTSYLLGLASVRGIDFVPNGCSTCGYLLGTNAGGTGINYFPNGQPVVPPFYRLQDGSRGDLGYYLADTFSPNTKLKIETGLRVDSADYHFYPNAIRFPNTPLPAGTGLAPGTPGSNPLQPVGSNLRNPSVLEPRLAASLRMGQNDSIRASYGLAADFAPLSFNQRVQNPVVFNSFVGIPVHGADGGKCGIFRDLQCADYAQELQAIYQNRVGLPYQPTLPETFANWDFSYSHAFKDDVSMRLTPFYRRGYNQVVRTNVVQTRDPLTGKPVLGPNTSTNGGDSHTTGVEFLLAKENRKAYGFSGTVSATYINEFTNVIPGTASEDFFPTVPQASLALGNEYRAGFVSPFQATAALEYKTKGGLRVVPNITYNRGYPVGTGTLTATFINGIPINVPLTDYTGAANGVLYSQFLDPQNPGSLTTPNIAANLGTGEKSSAGGLLGKANFFTNLTMEYSKPGSHNRSTIGFQMFNVFNQLYGSPFLNTTLQPVATGILGPQTGSQPNFFAPLIGQYGILDPTHDQFRYNSYNVNPGNTPRTANVYYRLSI